jgi:hypothetical protein
MANWTPITTRPLKAGKYRVKCGVTQDTFWALWNARRQLWTNLNGEGIAFGDRDCGDMWRISSLAGKH